MIPKLNQQEQIYYSKLYQHLDTQNVGAINGKDTVQFFKKSGLSVDNLKKIWITASSSGNTLDKNEFYIALKLIAYIQNNMDPLIENVQIGFECALPVFSDDFASGLLA